MIPAGRRPPRPPPPLPRFLQLPTPASNPDPAGFRFNLDDALARLSEPHHPIPRFNWSALSPTSTDALSPQGPMHTGPMAAGANASLPSPTSTPSMFPDQDSRARPLTQPTLDPLPEIREATQVGPAATAHWSTIPAAAPPPAALALPAPPVAAAPMIVSGTGAFAAGVSGFSPTPPTPQSRRDAQPARRRRCAATARVRAGCRAPDGNDDVGDGGSSDGEIGVGIDGPWSREGQTTPTSQAGPGRPPPGRALRRSADVRP